MDVRDFMLAYKASFISLWIHFSIQKITQRNMHLCLRTYTNGSMQCLRCTKFLQLPTRQLQKQFDAVPAALSVLFTFFLHNVLFKNHHRPTPSPPSKRLLVEGKEKWLDARYHDWPISDLYESKYFGQIPVSNFKNDADHFKIK